jgi:hypothetical protein
MAQQQEESEYLRKLRAIQDSVDWNALYANAQLELDIALTRKPGQTVFYLCSGQSDVARKCIGGRFIKDGLRAQLYDGPEVLAPCLRVTIPQRANKGVPRDDIAQ